MGASSFSPSPITTTPFMSTPSSARRMASTAAWSTISLLPLPIQRPALSAAASVTRTSSIPKLRSAVCDCSKRTSDIEKILLDFIKSLYGGDEYVNAQPVSLHGVDQQPPGGDLVG